MVNAQPCIPVTEPPGGLGAKLLFDTCRAVPFSSMNMTRTVALAICLLLIPATAIAQSGPPLNSDPEAVKFVTSDIENFWRAYDLAAKETDKAKRAAIFQTEYLDKGSPGLKDFLRLRITSAENLVSAIDRMPKYYASIRPQTLQVQRMEKRMPAAFVKF